MGTQHTSIVKNVSSRWRFGRDARYRQDDEWVVFRLGVRTTRQNWCHQTTRWRALETKTWPQHGGQLVEHCFHIDAGASFPYLSVKLPEILLGGSLNGVMLKMTCLWSRATQPLA